MPGHLNSFQKTMLQWNDLHPYSAVHVLRLAEKLDAARLRNVICRTLEQRGLTGLTLDRKRSVYEYSGGPARCEIRFFPESDTASSEKALHLEIERELNTPFPFTEPFDPFRFFIAPFGEGFFLSVTYFHAIGDAEAVVRLMQDIAAAYQNRASEAARPTIYPDAGEIVWRRPALLARKLASLPENIGRMRKSARVPCRDIHDQRIRFKFLSLDAAALGRIVNASREWKVTVNDLFLAVMLKTLGASSARQNHRKRHQISIGCIVNTRADLDPERAAAFGLFLGSFVVTHPARPDTALPDIARDVRRQTAAIKQSRLYMASSLELDVGRFMLSLFSTERRKKLYQKHYPLWGGITNMNLNSLWNQPSGEASVDYFRAVSTGPVTPLVVSVTTVGDHVNIGLTCRVSIFSAEEFERVRTGLITEIHQLAA